MIDGIGIRSGHKCAVVVKPGRADPSWLPAASDGVIRDPENVKVLGLLVLGICHVTHAHPLV